MKNLFYYSIIFVLFSCSKEEKKEEVSLFNSILINLKDSQGNNLLNSPNYSSDNIKIFYVSNSVATEFNQPNLDNPKAFRIINTGIDARIGISLNHNAEEYPITYIQWNSTDTDTIKAHYNRGDNHVLLDKVWINNVLLTPTSGIAGMEFIVTK